MRFIALFLFFLHLATPQTGVLTSRYDQWGTGANTRESSLNVSNVNTTRFGKLYAYAVEGSVYAQPLYVPDVSIPHQGKHNVLYVATMKDKVYAFDADKAGPPLWVRDFTDNTNGVTPVPVSDITGSNDLNIVGDIGIESTPVVDLTRGVLYLLARTKEQGHYIQRLYALKLDSGKDKHKPASIEAQIDSTAKEAINGKLRFDAKAGNQRTALALSRDKIIIAWASHEDIRPYHGWIMAYNARSLKQIAAFSPAPNGEEAGIWQSGRGPAIDQDGYIYYETGNGSWDGKTEFSDSVLKLELAKKSFVIADYFTPSDYDYLNRRDADLGSTGPLLIPNSNVLICGNKQGILYLLNTRQLGHESATNEHVLQALPVRGGRVLSGPVYWEGPAGPMVYVWCEADFLKAYHFNGSRLATTPSARGKIGSHGSPGGALTVSSNASQHGTGIVWGTISLNRSADHGNAQGGLFAFNAETLELLWSSEENSERDRLGTLVKFNPPTVANGKVYAATYDNAVNVYGQLPLN